MHCQSRRQREPVCQEVPRGENPGGRGQALLCPRPPSLRPGHPHVPCKPRSSVLPVTCPLRRSGPGPRHLQETSAGPQREESLGNISKASGSAGVQDQLCSLRRGTAARLTTALPSQQDPETLPRRSVSPGPWGPEGLCQGQGLDCQLSVPSLRRSPGGADSLGVGQGALDVSLSSPGCFWLHRPGRAPGGLPAPSSTPLALPPVLLPPSPPAPRGLTAGLMSAPPHSPVRLWPLRTPMSVPAAVRVVCLRGRAGRGRWGSRVVCLRGRAGRGRWGSWPQAGGPVGPWEGSSLGGLM